MKAADAAAILDGIPADAPDGDKEDHIGALIDRARELLGTDGFDHIRQQSLESIRQDIENDLAEFGVTFDRWYSEQSLTTSGRIDAALAVLEERGMLYQKDGATWFRAEQFGDEKDRVVVRANGVKTYFASDIAYHFDKRERGYDYLIDILGSDHHGYVARVRAGLAAMGYEADSLDVELMQFVALYQANVGHEGGERVGECGGRQGGGHLDENVVQVGPHFGSGVECSKPFQGAANAAREEEGAQWVTLPGARGGQQRRDARGGGGEQLRGLLIQQREQGDCLSQVLR
jgi:hypothetical protein